MSVAIQINKDFDVSRLVIDGDLSKLSPEQKTQYYLLRCKEHKLSASSQPFNYLKLNGKEVLYANKGCAEQLRSINKVSIKIPKADMVGDLFVVIAEAKDGDGREDSSTGAVPILGLKGEHLANAMMKAETKAKRRVTLSICGLNMLDETEVDSITEAQRPPVLADGYRAPGRAPEPGDGIIIDPKDKPYTVDFGKWNARPLEQIHQLFGAKAMIDYIDYLEGSSEKKGQPIDPNGRVGIFIREATNFLNAIEGEFDPKA